jgi:two-component system cell cycle sensor histidine kinase PleC
MSHLVEQMVFTTQLEAGVIDRNSVEESGVPVHLWELLVATVGLARRFAFRNRDISIRMDQRDRNSIILCDMPSLKHALAELICNALNFSPENGEVVLSQWETESVVWVSILDEGEGMTPEKVEEALLPFRQLSRETREQQGLGMGLPLARRIIETHGGKMKINTVAERGTQVIVGLPAYHE